MIEDIEGTLELADLGASLQLREIYEGVTFPPRLRQRVVADGR